jgi:hypothetical protein
MHRDCELVPALMVDVPSLQLMQVAEFVEAEYWPVGQGLQLLFEMYVPAGQDGSSGVSCGVVKIRKFQSQTVNFMCYQ